MRFMISVLLVVLAIHDVHAGNDLQNWLIGPVIGIQLGGHPASRLVIGFEGGGGYGPERINLGFEHRDAKDVVYIELDPWYIVGGSLGIAVDTDGKLSGLAGVWEGLPLTDTGSCSGWHHEITLAGGYRYTGVHELYLTMKAGMMDGNPCF